MQHTRRGLLCDSAHVVRASYYRAYSDLPAEKVQMPIVSKIVSCVHQPLTEIACRMAGYVCFRKGKEGQDLQDAAP